MIIKQITRLLLHGALAQMASRRHEQHTMFFVLDLIAAG